MAKLSETDQLDELIFSLKNVRDPRVAGRTRHLLIDILVLTVVAVLCGAEGVTEIEDFGHQKEKFLRKHLELPGGIPSHDTITRVLSIINPESFESAFASWVSRSLYAEKEDWISIDGKSVNGTERNSIRGARPLHLVSAYSHTSGLSLCQAESTTSGMAEKDAALKCLKQLDLKGVTVTMDAGLNNRQIIDHILENDGHYLTPVKKNHRSALRLLSELFTSNVGETATIEEKVHGRADTRSCSVIPAEKLFVTFSESFPAAVTAIQMTRTRIEKDKSLMTRTKEEDGRWRLEKNQAETKETTSTVYYVSSQKISALEAIEWTRQHWGIENKLHWILDIAFREDDWMVRAKSAARSLSVARKIAFNLIKTSSTRGSVRARMKRASWSDEFLEQLLIR